MSNILIIGLTTEGSTDRRFLESIVRRTFEAIALECSSLIEIHTIASIEANGDTFEAKLRDAAIKADNLGVMVLCVHTDADDRSDDHAFQNKIVPAFSFVANDQEILCNVFVPVVPVVMSEAWMLADADLMKDEIGTKESIERLGLHRVPEIVADPKEVIKSALRTALEDTTRRRRRNVNISELYQPIGQKIDLNKLETLESYLKFKEAVKDAFRKLNYLY